MSRTLNMLAVVVAVVAMVGCGPSGSEPLSPMGDPAPLPGEAPGAGGAPDCTRITPGVVETYSNGVQVLAQLNTRAGVEAVRTGSLEFDPVSFDAALSSLRTLEGRGVEGYADPGESLDLYQRANDAASSLLSGDGEVAAEDLSEYAGVIGTSENMILAQAPINAALVEHCDY